MNEELKEFCSIYQHKFIVLQFLNQIIIDLIKRAESHDISKFQDDEFPGLVAAMGEIAKYPYGTPEYEEVRKKHAKTFANHYKKNRHHPEHFSNGVEDMTLVDLIEMLMDWKAASMRSSNGGTIQNSITVGADKFKINPVLVKILENTAKEYKL